METIDVTVSVPRSLLAAVGVGERELPAVLREAVSVELYRQGRLSFGKAAEVAGAATKWEMMGVLARHGVWLEYSADDAAADAALLQS